MQFDRFALAQAEGTVLAHGVKAEGIVFRKGRQLSQDDLERLGAAGVTSVVAVRFAPDDVAEDEAAAHLADLVAGPGVAAATAFTGRANLHAETRGVLVLDAERIDLFNQIDEAVTLATLPPYAVVEPRQMVATVKIIPFAIPRSLLERCCTALAAAPPVRVARFRRQRARLIQTELPSVAPKVLDKTVRITRDRLEAVGGELLGETRCAHEPGALTARIREAKRAGFDLLLIAGASAIADRNDVLPMAIEAAGGTVEHFGMPVDPGNLLLLARLGEQPVLGLPGCCRSPKLNGFDWVLERLAAGVPVIGRDLMRMGVGGLLSEIPSRPQPRERQEVPPHARIAAIVLAAGQSRRMGGPNKLLLPVAGKPMVRHVVEAALASTAAPVMVVLGHQQHEVRQALRGLRVHFATNPAFAEGLSTSLRAGIAALPPEVDGAVVCLGDMPLVSAGLIDRLIGAFDPDAGRRIVVPTWQGRRGNPVLLARELFDAVAAITGDVGARDLLRAHAASVAEIEAEDDAALIDIDTPEALAAHAEAGA